MPTSKETIPNRMLTGTELQAIIEEDVHAILSRDGVFSGHMAFGRVSYEVTVKLHLDNPSYPEHSTGVTSRPTPTHPTVESPPLKSPSDESAVIATKRTRAITNPNLERVKRGMPVTAYATDPNTGRLEEKKIVYDKGLVPGAEASTEIGAADEDVSKKAKAEWDLTK